MNKYILALLLPGLVFAAPIEHTVVEGSTSMSGRFSSSVYHGGTASLKTNIMSGHIMRVTGITKTAHNGGAMGVIYSNPGGLIHENVKSGDEFTAVSSGMGIFLAEYTGSVNGSVSFTIDYTITEPEIEPKSCPSPTVEYVYPQSCPKPKVVVIPLF